MIRIICGILGALLIACGIALTIYCVRDPEEKELAPVWIAMLFTYGFICTALAITGGAE